MAYRCFRGFVATVAVALAPVFPACSSHPQGQLCMGGTGAGVNGTVQSAMIGGGCGGLNGSAAAGQSCKTGADCASVCCACGDLANGKSASVGYCSQGVCVVGNDACCAFLAEQQQTPAAQRTCQ